MMAIGWRAIVLLPALVLTYIVGPLVLLFFNRAAENLPHPFQWMQTWDAGINGDQYWIGPKHANGRERTWWWRARWLWRNPCGRFRYYTIGLDLNRVAYYHLMGDVKTNNNPGHAGRLYATAHLIDGTVRTCLFSVRPWGAGKRCLRHYLGWKFRRNAPIDQWPKDGRAEYVFSINPFSEFVK